MARRTSTARTHAARDGGSPGHHPAVGRPHDAAAEGPVAVAEGEAGRMRTAADPMGRLGPPFNWRSPFLVAVAATVGVAVTYGVIELFLLAAHVMVLIGVGLFLAVGMDPAVSWLVAHRFPRWLGVLTVLAVIIAAVAGFVAAAVPALATQIDQLVAAVPGYLRQLNDHSSFLGSLNDRFQIETKVQSALSGSSGSIVDWLLGVGAAVFSAFADSLIVLVLTVYFLASMPQIRAWGYRLVPHTRRPRAILIGDDILAKVGGYVLGNLIVSGVAGLLTYGWLLVTGVPYALLLALLVALLDLVPVVGSTIAGIVVALVALSVSLPICLATIAFFVVYRLLEDYLLVPRVIGRAVEVPALVTVVAVLVGGAVFGIIGALVAIPVAAAMLLISREVLFPRLDQL